MIDDALPWWTRVEASSWAEVQVEASGSTSATWLFEPESERSWLHKHTVIPDTGIEQGEDWAEAIATQVALQLGVPCAMVRLASRSGRDGSLSLNLRPRGYSFWLGNQWLVDRAPGYVPQSEGVKEVDPDRPGVRRPGHTLENFRLALEETSAPQSFAGPTQTGFDVLAGFLILDALIANRDRHTENRAVLEPEVGAGQPMLAPSYDHGGSLGYNVRDEDRLRHLDGRGVRAWVTSSKASAHRFEYETGAPKASLVDVALASLDLCSPEARAWWVDRIRYLDLAELVDQVRSGAVLSMSDPARRFATAVLEANVERMRDAIDDDAPPRRALGG